MAGIGAPIRLQAPSLPRRLRLGCSAIALLAGLAALGVAMEPARADGIKIVGMRPVRVDSAGAGNGGAAGGGGNGASSNSAVANALNRAASAGNSGGLFNGMQLNRVVAGASNPVVDSVNKLMTIDQLKPKAIINWNRFNIASGETVKFDQHGNADWAVLNKIGQADPSRIDGALKADGHVYLINQNGVIFGKGAQVNVRNLVASSLNISTDRFMKGILENHPDQGSQPSKWLTDFEAVDDSGNAYTPGAVKVGQGAVIQGPENGSVILLGGSVTNDGTIRASGGQVVLAAGSAIGLEAPGNHLDASTPQGKAIDTAEQKTRGVMLTVNGAADPEGDSDTADRVVNTGTIETPHGNITIAGKTVTQMGRLSATTSVRANGSIIIDSIVHGSPETVGSATFSRGSVTEILPEDSADTITDAETFLHSQIAVAGSITMEQGSLIHAPAGDVQMLPGDGRFYMDWFSRIDVSGTTTTEVAMERNQISIKLGDNELNSPLQRNGFLYKKTINVDVREGSPIGSIDGFLKTIGRTAVERSAVGGTVSIASAATEQDANVVIRQGAVIDVSGGQVRYRGGYIDTTQLVGADGRIYDISQATPDIQYVDFAEHRYAQQQVYGPQYQAGYTDGMAAGSVTITTGAAVIEGRIVGQATPGARQRTTDQLPALGSLALTFTRPVDVVFQGGGSGLPGGFSADTELPEDLGNRLVLDPSVVGAAGVDKILVVTGGGDIAVPRGVTLHTAPGGSVNLLAGPHVQDTGLYQTDLENFGNILVGGAIEAPSGSIGLSGRNIALAAGARLTARGQWVNDTIDAQGNPLRDGASAVGAALPDGGSINLSALQGLALAGGSLIDVSAGGWVAADGSLTKGKGGSVALATSRYVDPTNPAATPNTIRPSEGRLVLGGDILGYGLDRGGSLTIRTDRIWIGGGLAPDGALVLDPGFLSRGGFSDVTLQGYRGVTVARGAVVTPAAATLQLNPGYLNRATGSDVFGFAQLQVLPENLRPSGSLTLIARGSDVRADDYAADAIDPTTGEPFNYEGGGDVVFGEGSVVRMGMGGSVTAVAARSVRVDGTIETPAGQISLSGGVTPDIAPVTQDDGTPIGAGHVYDPEAGVRIGATGRLLARGAVKLDVTTDGTRRGTVLDGGGITLAAYNGAVIVESGALLDVSGVSTDIDIRSMTMYGLRYRSQRIASNGGTIQLTGSDGLFVDGTLLGHGGGAGAEGGTLITELLNRLQHPGSDRAGLPFGLVRVLNIRQSGLSGAGDYDPDALRARAGQGYVAADTVMDGGFGSWVMSSSNVVNFDGDVRVKLDREIQVNAFTLAATPAAPGEGSLVHLEAPHVTFSNTSFETFGNPDYRFWVSGTSAALTTPITGPAPRLEVFADLIDFRNGGLHLGANYTATRTDPVTFQRVDQTTSFSGFGEALFQSSGDIRFTGVRSGVGSLDSAGDLVFKAAQLYPTTESNYTIRALGTVTVLPNGNVAAPFSIGGQLTIQAPKVIQNGTIRAPLGQIVLGLDGGDLILGRGSLTSVSAEGMTVPYGFVQSGALWIDPSGQRIDTPPEKEVRLRGSNVEVDDGATIDVRGGGDLLASEFVPGLGGPSDVLSDPNSFAIIPGYSGYAPIDPYMTGQASNRNGLTQVNFQTDIPAIGSTAQVSASYLNQGSATTLRVGDSIYLSGGGGLPAGTYVLLPARYALMPGAYRVRAFGGSLDRLPAMNGRAPDGSAFISGRLSVQNTSISDARWTGFQIESGEVVRQRAEYDDYTANSFFQSAAFLNRQKTDGRIAAPPALPIDGGTLVANATETLTLDGTAMFAPATGGRLGRFDIAAAKVAVVSAGEDTEDLADQGYLLLQAEQLNDFGVGSLMIGGERTAVAPTTADPRGGTQVSVSSTDVVVRNDGTPLQGEEILLVASNSVTVESGSVIRATGADAGQGDTLRISNNDGSKDGALLRVSTGDRVDVVRDSPDGLGGTLTIQDGAAVLASGSLALDATGDTILATTQIAGGRAIDAAAGRISFGDAPAGTAGLVFRDGTLGVLAQTGTLTLHGYNGIDFYGDVAIGAGQGSSLQTLSLDSPVLVGDGGTIAINAGTVRLRNTGAAFDGDVAAAGGSLTITAGTRIGTDGKPVAGTGRIDLADGPVRIAGFGGVTLAADERLVGTSGLDIATDLATGSGTDTRPNRLKVDGALTLTAAALSAGAGADNAIAAGGALSFIGRAVANLPGFDEIGGRLRLSGDTVTLAGQVEVRAGILEVAATGNVVIADGTTIDASGVAQTFFDQTRYAPGGTVKLSSAQGDVVLAGGARIALDGTAGVSTGDPGGDAGQLIVDAPHGRFPADGTIDAHSADGTRQGQVDLDVGALDGSFDALAGKLAAAGFVEAQQLRIRSGDVALTTAIRAREFALSVDGGSLDVSGTIDASGATGGDIRLAAGGTLTLENGAVLNASGAAADAAAKGGSVLLAAGDNGRLDLRSGSTILVGAGGSTGTVKLRAPRTSNGTDVAIDPIGSRIDGARQITVEAYKAFNDVSTIDQGVIDQVASDARDFASHAGAIANRLGGNVTVQAGEELRSDGDMTLTTDWDLQPLSQDGVNGVLTLRAGGDLTLLGNLSDGFAIRTDENGNPILDPSTGLLVSAPQDIESWSYRLVGGADLTGADPLAVRARTDLKPYDPSDPGYDPAHPELLKGNVLLEPVGPGGPGIPPLFIRTGTGDIDVAAAADVVLTARTNSNLDDTGNIYNPAVIYTGGRPIKLSQDQDGFAPPAQANYPTGGGDISIVAGGGLYGVPVNQVITSYAQRQGDLGDFDGGASSGLPSSWWINFDNFQQGVGALGGGNVLLRAEGDISNLSAVIPTVGWVSGDAASGTVNIRNGGNLTVDALGDIISGVYYVGRGEVAIESGGAIKDGASVLDFNSGQFFTLHTILGVGDASFQLRSRGDLAIETAVDPLLVGGDLFRAGGTAGFFSPGETHSVSLASIGGNVLLGNDANAVGTLMGAVTTDGQFLAVLYPSTLRATAFSGDITIDGGMVMASSDRGTLELLAADDVVFRPNGDGSGSKFYNLQYLAMADADRQFEPTPLNPISTLLTGPTGSPEQQAFEIAHLLSNKSQDQAARHIGDRDPVRIYAGGDIREEGGFPDTSYGVIIAKSLVMRAGGDIADLSLNVRNVNADDVTVVEAGGDITLTQTRSSEPFSVFDPGVSGARNGGGILVGGPGRLNVVAGGSIDLGHGYGIVSLGNLGASVLPEQGADISVLAGLGSGPQDRAGFLAHYLDPAGTVVDYLQGDGGSIYTAEMIAYVEQVTGKTGLDAATAYALLKTLSPDQQDPLVQDILFAELRASGREAGDPSSPRVNATDRGYAAADALFPGDGYAGDITMSDSQIKTARGGDISILAPGGSVVLGTSTAENGFTPKPPSDSGLWTLLGGAIRVFAHDDVLLRSSRALTASGGDILMWSSFGDIDAGIGSRGAIATAPPLVRLSLNGTLQVEPGGIISGSGIGALQPPGDVDLYAPKGVVNAGEAGIRVAGNFNVFAVQVLNADNIQVGGKSVGLPSATVNPASIAGTSDVAAAATRAIEQQVRDQAEKSAKPGDDAPPLLITGSFLGYDQG